MKVLKGGSAEVSTNRWHKFDIELDESDLQAIVIKNNIDGDKLSVIQKYQILKSYGEILVTMEFEAQGLNGDVSAKLLSAQLTQMLNNLPKVES
jgi:hypothetical protein